MRGSELSECLDEGPRLATQGGDRGEVNCEKVDNIVRVGGLSAWLDDRMSLESKGGDKDGLYGRGAEHQELGLDEKIPLKGLSLAKEQDGLQGPGDRGGEGELENCTSDLQAPLVKNNIPDLPVRLVKELPVQLVKNVPVQPVDDRQSGADLQHEGSEAVQCDQTEMSAKNEGLLQGDQQDSKERNVKTENCDHRKENDLQCDHAEKRKRKTIDKNNPSTTTPHAKPPPTTHGMTRN